MSRLLITGASGQAGHALQVCATPRLPTLAARPPCPIVDCSKIETVLGITPPPWSGGVDSVIAGLTEAD